MLLESLLVFGILVVILMFFYKQAVQEFRILQTESLEKAMPLLQERCPVVVLPAPQPQQLWTRADLKQRPTLANHPLRQSQRLADAVTAESFPMKPAEAALVAKQVGLPVWVEHEILPFYKKSQWWSPAMTTRTEVCIGAQPLRQTYAYSTILMVTEHAIQVSLVNESANPYLPTAWKGKRLSKMTRDDAPLLGQIQFVDVIVRPGSALLLPPHWKVCWETHESKESALAIWTEIHHPLSSMSNRAALR
jgi:hypothetical protein